MRPLAWFFAIVVVVFLLPAAAGADINEPSGIPDFLSDREDLVSQHSSLTDQAKALEKKIAQHNARCSSIPEDSPKVGKCQSNQAEILAAIEAYNKSLQSYEDALAKASTPRNLSKDPEAARVSEARLREVENQIDRLQKCINLLSYEKNPNWAKSWNDLMTEMRETDSDEFWLGMDLIVVGIVGKIKLLQGHGVKTPKKAKKLSIWKELTEAHADLKKITWSWKGQVGQVGKKFTEAMQHLAQAPRAEDLVEALEIVEEACTKAKDGYDEAKKIVRDPKTLNLLYHGCTIVGNTATVFAEESIKDNPLGIAVDTSLKLIEAGFLVKESFEEDRRLHELAAQSYDRHQKQLELERKMGELQELRANLQWTISKAR